MTERRRGRAGETGAPGGGGTQVPVLSRRRALALAAVVVFAWIVLAVRSEVQQHAILRNQQQIRESQVRIAENQRQIARTQYDQCALRNVGTRRQNALLDSAIAAEKRRATPDPKRIKDLTDFKGTLLDCGSPPAGPRG